MKLLELGVLNETQVFAIFLTILLAICSFFLTQFYFMVKKMMEDIKDILIKDAQDSQRLHRLEDEMDEVKTDIKNHYRRKDA